MTVFAAPAMADGLYYGLGLGVTDAKSEQSVTGGGHSEATFGTLGATLGYRWDRDTYFLGTEANLNLGLGTDFDDSGTGQACKTNANGPYYCSQKAILRLRGMIGSDVGKDVEIFGTLGLAAMVGDGATNANTQDRGVNTGVTVGMGLQKQIGRNTHRVELIYDDLSHTVSQPVSHFGTGYSPDYSAVSLNYTFIFGK